MRMVHSVQTAVLSNIYIQYIQSGAAALSKGFVKCFLRVPQVVGCTAAAMGNFQKTYYKTFGTSCRPRLY